MADFNLMIPFIFHFAAGVYGKNGNDLSLPVERQFILARKNGWSDDPDDPGGATMIDVTLTTYATYRKRKGLSVPTKEDLRNISFCEWSEILKTMYWDRFKADEINSQGLAHILVDWIWASGCSKIKTVQKMLGVAPDGIVGPVTMKALNDAEKDLFPIIRKERERQYRSCRGAWKFLRGWLRRLNAINPDGTFSFR